MKAETGEMVGIYVTDNGELKSTSMKDWCVSHRTVYQFTTLYSSAQNGRCECCHLVVFNKGWTMKISCGAPNSLWDKFTTMANYLHNFTATLANKSKMP